ncbi:acetyl-CoA carboxylase biotin carboxylase subunit family protein [Streptomyces termitum]|uniref:acetyl-CoA carboxylase biotin carboxylase subunit family protein n=1 Tax=Streptomyces termitum TaxID=67368 RepID=UPI0037B34268
MKTAVILSARGMPMFRPDLVEDPDAKRLVLIVSEVEWAATPEHVRGYFDRVYVEPCAYDDPPALLTSAVAPDAVRRALKEVTSDPAAGTVTLHCYDELFMMFAAELREEFGLGGPHPADMLPYRDKCVMKEKLVGSGVRFPRFHRFDKEHHARDRAGHFTWIVAEVGLPFILKPVDSAGSEGVRRIDSRADFAALPEELEGDWEIEEFVTGTMYSVNLVTEGGRTVFGGVTEYLVNTLEVVQGRVNADINLHDDDPRVARMVAFAEQALDALGRIDGSTHLELFLTPRDELVFLEVGARFKGLAGLAAMQRNYAAAIVNMTLQAESGITSRPYPHPPEYCFDAVIPKRAGRVEARNEPVIESPYEITWKVREGDELDSTDSLFTAGGTFLVWNADYDVLYRDFYALADYQPLTYRQPKDEPA